MTWALQITGPLMLAAVLGISVSATAWDSTRRTAGVLAGTLASAAAVAAPRLRRRLHRSAPAVEQGSVRELVELRQYVPATIADHIVHGQGIETGEREVTVMFVDLHEYTAFAQDLAPNEVFAFISRFTEDVSAAIRDHGGFVVEFNGDGMMAVFGALEEQADKERAAMRAARAALTAVASLDSSEQGPDVPAVGIGVATGQAFVGKIRAADRCVWSAVGTTTNRASRLQTLAKTLGASIVLDAATHAGAGDDRELVELPKVPIRGLRAPVDLYAVLRVSE
jgi:adenylate cyclase